MNEQVERYLRGRRHELAPETFKNVASTIKRLDADWSKTRRSLSSLSEDWLADWLYEMSRGSANGGRPVSPAYFNKEVDRVRHFLNWLVRRSLVNPHALDACRPMPVGKPKEYLRLSMAQVVQMIETAEDPWERWVLALASQTLGRDSELRSRRIRDLRLDLGELDWFRKKTADTDKLPITAQLEAEWRRWAMVYQERCGSLEKGWFLVPRRFYTPVNEVRWNYRPTHPPYRLSQIVQKHAARITGDEDLRGQGVHIMRRSMARALYDRLVADGWPEPTALNRVQVMLGHSSPQTTMIYIGVQPDRLKRNELLSGSSLLWVENENVVQLRSAGNE